MSAESPPFNAPGAVPPAKPRRRRALFWVLGILVAGIAFVALLPALLSTGLARAAIHSWLEDNVDNKVVFDKLSVSWMHGLRLEGLHVSDDTGGDRPLLEAPVVEIDAPLLPVLWKKIHAKKFVIEGATLHVAPRGENESNVEGVVKRKKVRRKHRGDGPEEESVLPEIHVPVEVTNLTVVFQNREGREASQRNISFKGLLDTREGQTTFDLAVPMGANGAGLFIKGEARLFESDGTWLPKDQRKVDATVTLVRIDAQENHDFVALVLGDSPASGVLEGKFELHQTGPDATGDIDLHLRGVGYGAAAAGAASRQGDDLTMTGRWSKKGDVYQLSGVKVRAEGLTIDADISGTLGAPQGAATLDADLGRIAGTLRAVGFDFPGTMSGKLNGSLAFAGTPSKGKGDFTLTALRIDGVVPDRPPVTIDAAKITFEAAPTAERFDLISFDVKLPDLFAAAHGSRAADGTLDLTADAKGDLGGILGRIRDLGFLPAAFAFNGKLDASAHIGGKSGAYVVDVKQFVLTEQDARIEMAGTRAADGTLDFHASGAGDLGNLFGRARAAGSGPQGIENIKGRFAFEATAKGPPDALLLDVPKLHVDGDLNVEARGKMTPDGQIDVQVSDVSGKVDDILLLLRRMAIIDRDFSVAGRIVATAAIKGTRKEPEVPRLTLKMTGGPVTVEANGSVAANGAIAGEAMVTGDLDVIADIAQKAGATKERMALTGSLVARAKFAGQRDAIAVPEFNVSVANGPADGKADGSYAADGTYAATVSASGPLDRTLEFAKSQGWLKRGATTGCTFTMKAVVTGKKDVFEVTGAKFSMNGPLRADAEGRMGTDRAFAASGKIDGALQTLIDVAAAWSGEEAKRIEGTVTAAFSADGKPDSFGVRVPQMTLKTRALQLDADGTYAADGTGKGSIKAAGPLADLLAVTRAFGVAADVDATGRVDADMKGSYENGRATGSLSAAVTDFVMTKPEVGGAVFKEPRMTVSIPSVDYDTKGKRLQPVKAQLAFDGAKLDVTKASMDAGILSLEGSIFADETFAKHHPELLSDASFQKLSGPFDFSGDVSDGLANAQGWKGGFTLEATGVTAPHVNLSTVKLPGKFDQGTLVMDPITATMNGGPVSGSMRVGLAGADPAHRLVLTGKDISLDTDLAPLLANASPIFAVGEDGKAGGKAAIDMDLAANGFKSQRIKRTMTGKGVVGLEGAYVESSNLLGQLLQLVGTSNRIDIKPVKIPFVVRDSKVETGEMVMEAVGLTLKTGGTVTLDGALDYALKIKTQGGGGALGKLGSALDPEGYIPLRLEGTISKPKVKPPDVKDVLTNALGGLFGGKDDKDDEPADKPKKPKKKKPPQDPPPAPTGEPKSGTPETPAPPPPPPKDGGEKTDPPPPPPPADDPPPPPPPPPRKKGGDDPPPPPPPK